MTLTQLSQKRTQQRQPVILKTPVYRLMRGQRVFHNGEVRKVARVFNCLIRAQGFHVHLIPLDYEPLPGWESYDPKPWSQPETAGERKARAHEARHLIRVLRPENGNLPVILEDWDLRTDIQGNDHLTYGEAPPHPCLPRSTAQPIYRWRRLSPGDENLTPTH